MVDLKEMQKDIDEMAKALEEPQAGSDDLRTNPPGTQAPGTQAPGTQAPGTQSPETDAPGTQAPGTSAPSTDAPAEDPRDVELRKLREEVIELKKGPSTKAPSTRAPSTDAPIATEDFLGDVDLDDLTRSKDLLNKTLFDVYKKGREATRAELKKAVENVVRSIPDITKNTLAIQAQLAEVNKRFYEENKDLVPWKKSVASVFEELSSENPGKRYDELLPLVATEVRSRLGLQKRAIQDDKGNPPKLPKKKPGKRQPTEPDLSKFEKDIDDMDKALGLD